MADQLDPPLGAINMAKNKHSRSGRAKDSASNIGASKKASAGGRKDGKGKASEFRVLPKSATLDEREAYVRTHAGNAKQARRKELKHCWCIGRELPKIKAEKKLDNNASDAYFKETFGFGVRQGNNYEQLAKAFQSIEEMLKHTPEELSLSRAADVARTKCGPTPEPGARPGDSEGGNRPGHQDRSTTTGPGPSGPAKGESLESNPPPDREPPRSPETLELVKHITFLVCRLGDQHASLLKKVYSLLSEGTDGNGDINVPARESKRKKLG